LAKNRKRDRRGGWEKKEVSDLTFVEGSIETEKTSMKVITSAKGGGENNRGKKKKRGN